MVINKNVERNQLLILGFVSSQFKNEWNSKQFVWIKKKLPYIYVTMMHRHKAQKNN